jgi:hypothetical protein
VGWELWNMMYEQFPAQWGGWFFWFIGKRRYGSSKEFRDWERHAEDLCAYCGGEAGTDIKPGKKY